MTTEFVRPGPVGRAVRLGLGIGLLLSLLLTSPGERLAPDGLFWMLAGYAVWSSTHLVTMGLDRDPQLSPRVGFLLVIGASMGANMALYRRLWAPLGAWSVYLGLLIVVGMQSLAFILAALLATPGCEWRAFADLIARLHTEEFEGARACPLGLHKVDVWEYRRNHAPMHDEK